MEDAELLGRAARGDRSAFETFMRRHYSSVFGFLSRGSREPEDLAQQVFVKAYLGAGSFRGSGSARGWLYAIASNIRIDGFRRRPPSPRPSDPTAAWERQENAAAVEEALGRLEEQDRRLLWLKYVEGLSFSELGEALRAPVTTLKYRAGRALSALAVHLGKGDHELRQIR